MAKDSLFFFRKVMRVGCWVFFKQTIVVIFFKRRKKYSEEEEQSRGRKRIEEDQPEIAWEILSSLININKIFVMSKSYHF